ncbi:MAG: UDP-N-acetylglucosamine 4,6-dehydratase [Legionellales bacterium]|nr:UDP-N-acetylglucosamine 4,6-dehydratase [Legionellales bacterium]
MDVLKLVGRTGRLFESDLEKHKDFLEDSIRGSRFLVLGGAGSIGQAVVKELYKRSPLALHVVDISENNMVELVRDIRSTNTRESGDFRTFALDCNSPEFDAMVDVEGPYQFVLNLSALKHVRSEKDPYTLMRMIGVNVFNGRHASRLARSMDSSNYFCVSTDKAANPVNMMGASKKIMEMFLMRESESQPTSMARFANVAFSDGSLLHGFNQRFMKSQPFSAPSDVRRYFLVPEESGELCLLACMLGKNRDIFFPKLSEENHQKTFSEIATNYLEQKGFSVFLCSSEDEAKGKMNELASKKKWPCFFFESDTTGEKSFEEFYTDKEDLEMSLFEDIGVIKSPAIYDSNQLDEFERQIDALRSKGKWTKEEIVELFHYLVPSFQHIETGKNLDQKM